MNLLKSINLEEWEDAQIHGRLSGDYRLAEVEKALNDIVRNKLEKARGEGRHDQSQPAWPKGSCPGGAGGAGVGTTPRRSAAVLRR